MKTKTPTTDRFPREYWDIVEVVGEQEQILRIPFPTKAGAHNLRQRLYRFRNLAIQELPKLIDGFDNPKVLALHALYLYIEEPQGDNPNYHVVITPRSATPDAVNIRNALNALINHKEEYESPES